ncbi:hypothetical protein KC344_g74 [Hortaea werneckii]|nr:hypothetical protein KC344_g74 [Hortaea werneckii]
MRGVQSPADYFPRAISIHDGTMMLCKAPCIGISRTMHTFGQFQVVNVSEEIWITSVGYGEVHVGATQWLLIWTKNAQKSSFLAVPPCSMLYLFFRLWFVEDQRLPRDVAGLVA